MMPVYGAVSFLIFFGSMGLPGLCGFVAEVFVVLSAFNYSIVLAVLAAAAVILTAGYILWTLQRVFLGRQRAVRGPARPDPPRDGHRRAAGRPDRRPGRVPPERARAGWARRSTGSSATSPRRPAMSSPAPIAERLPGPEGPRAR